MNARCVSFVVMGTMLGMLAILGGCSPSSQSGSPKLTDVVGAFATNASPNTNGGAAAQRADGQDQADDTEADDGANSLVLEAEASSAALRAEVKYEQETSGTSFEVEIVIGQPGASVDVTFAGRVLVSVSLDSHGAGRAEWGSAPDDSSEQPLPADFPTLKAGDVLSVGDLSLTLAVDEED